MSAHKILIVVALALLLAQTAVVLAGIGFIGFFRVAWLNDATRLMFLDLVITLSLISIWMRKDAVATGRNPVPYLVLTVLLGSAGPLLYLLRRGQARPTLDDLRRESIRLTEEAWALIAGMSEQQAMQPASDGGWSVAQHLEHLAMVNEQLLVSMQAAVTRRPASGPTRALHPGVIGAWFLKLLEPPPKPRVLAPAAVQPRRTTTGVAAYERFAQSVDAMNELIDKGQRIDFNRIPFPHPFLPFGRFNVATGLLMTAAHARRHLWLAARVRHGLVAVSLSETTRAIGGDRVART